MFSVRKDKLKVITIYKHNSLLTFNNKEVNYPHHYNDHYDNSNTAIAPPGVWLLILENVKLEGEIQYLGIN